MPNRPNDDGLRDRVSRLSDQLDKQSEELKNVDRGVVKLGAEAANQSQVLSKLQSAINDLAKTVDEKTSPLRTVTWKQLIGITTAFSVVLGPLFSFVLMSVYSWYLPKRIEEVVTNSDSLKLRFTTLETSLVNKLEPTRDTLARIEKSTNELNEKLNGMKSAVKTTVGRKNIVQSLKNHTSGRRITGSNKLAEVQNLLVAVGDLKIPLERQDYKDLSSRLYAHYLAAKDAKEREELLATYIKAANAKSVSEPTLHEVDASDLAKAKANNKYFEGTVDLSSKDDWTGAIFDNCKIVISKPDKPVILHGVRFLSCTFDSIAETPQVRDFLSTYLESTRPTVTFPGYKVQIVSYAVNNKWH